MGEVAILLQSSDTCTPNPQLLYEREMFFFSTVWGFHSLLLLLDVFSHSSQNTINKWALNVDWKKVSFSHLHIHRQNARKFVICAIAIAVFCTISTFYQQDCTSDTTRTRAPITLSGHTHRALTHHHTLANTTKGIQQCSFNKIVCCQWETNRSTNQHSTHIRPCNI